MSEQLSTTHRLSAWLLSKLLTMQGLHVFELP
jgi:hypothetical protein